MRKQYLRWIVPVLVLLIMATVLILGPAIMSHAAGVKSASPAPTSTATPSKKVDPSYYWMN
ncbi:hypothetical protein [Dictyobacter formicarum]|uniref:Uncharacterized protein n=1 Tax=Dictyobacter formicarum TaxID=2778368 RepID=A0ABQ3VPL7_9CHLR|nr:hypothetical protein [Dictyobacter formicarum]GHO87318.1 hypothetical protein KSZ_53240 [Dictyobacter formicarum]